MLVDDSGISVSGKRVCNTADINLFHLICIVTFRKGS